jgi:hypothetical protein
LYRHHFEKTVRERAPPMSVNITVEEDIGWILLGGLAKRLKRG